MQPKDSNVLKRSRARRIVIPLLVAGVAMFVILGGHQRILNSAVGGVISFLSGTAASDQKAPLAQASPGRSEASSGSVFPAGILSEANAGEGSPKPVVAVVTPPKGVQTPDQARAAEQAPQVAPKPVPAEPESVATAVPIRQATQVYTASFLRDPFYSLIAAGKDRPTKLLDVARAKMVGSVWGESGIIALLEDDQGRSYALKVGDRVVNGKVISITPASITCSITVFGLTKTVTLELAEEGEE